MPEMTDRDHLHSTARLLLDKIALAALQLDVRQSVTTRKDKELFYENPDRKDKPTREIITESESARMEPCPVDRQGIQILAKALRDLEDLLDPADDADVRAITVRLEGAAEEFAL